MEIGISMKRLSALAPERFAAIILPRGTGSPRFIETQQNQGVCQIRAQSRKSLPELASARYKLLFWASSVIAGSQVSLCGRFSDGNEDTIRPCLHLKTRRK